MQTREYVLKDQLCYDEFMVAYLAGDAALQLDNVAAVYEAEISQYLHTATSHVTTKRQARLNLTLDSIF